MRYVNPKNDVAFKKIFGDKNDPQIVMSFINAVMGLEGERRITSIEILSPLQAPQIEGLKMTTLDVRAKDASGKSFIVEMQANAEDAFEKRSLFYTSQAYVGQLSVGNRYADLQPVYFIGILDFNLFEGTDYLTRHLLLESKTYKHYLSDFELYFIELKKFRKPLEDLSTILEKWIYFMQHAVEFEEPPDALQREAEIARALEIAARYRWTRDELEAYQYWEFERLNALVMEEENTALKAELAANKEELAANKQELERRTVQSVKALSKAGLANADIATTLQISEDDVRRLLSEA
ncbi:MAG: Rpn family recombination-promoting nuclease/putative transposase [Candidatus Kapabacteria bacterium]|jgi:predicted transposase/invertase (TIGR01784 family)|nr:Rpn family recombination-promoting nuclease/putative transposase [Candidatus Kapabacteria bacterium]